MIEDLGGPGVRRLLYGGQGEERRFGECVSATTPRLRRRASRTYPPSSSSTPRKGRPRNRAPFPFSAPVVGGEDGADEHRDERSRGRRDRRERGVALGVAGHAR